MIGFQGEPGAFSEEAIIGYFGDGATPLPLPTFRAVSAAVAEDRAAAGVLPLENSTAGGVGEAIDALLGFELSVAGEILLPVRHSLIALPGTSVEDVRTVTSHRQALAQCEQFVTGRGWSMVVAEDTAGAARQLMERRDPHTAVIASERAAQTYGLAVLSSDVQDATSNVTRFVVVARADRKPPLPAGPLAPRADAPWSSLIVFETRHLPGALHHALGAFADAGVNLSRIESRPTGRAQWQYHFLVSAGGHHRQRPLAPALTDLRSRAHRVRVLGSFRSAGDTEPDS